MKKQIHLDHFKNLVAVAFADGVLDQKELEILGDKATDYGIDADLVQEVLDNAHNLVFEVPLNKFDKEEQLADVVYMAMIDGKVHEKEYELCLRISERLDMDKTYLDKIIELTRKLWSLNS